MKIEDSYAKKEQKRGKIREEMSEKAYEKRGNRRFVCKKEQKWGKVREGIRGKAYEEARI